MRLLPSKKSDAVEVSTGGEAEDVSTDGDAHLSPVLSKRNNKDEQQMTPKVTFLIISVFLSVFLVALDRTIISTAIPQITNDFNSLPDVGWYGSAYLLTACAFQLLTGKIYTFYPVKAVFVASILLFEVGSVVCGAAPNSPAFIFGRAIAGMGSSGIMSGGIVAIVYAVPLAKRPVYQGLFGALFGIASIMGPLVGGAFTSNVSWRWCFYINLPFGGIALAAVAFCLTVPDRETTKLHWKKKLLQLDAPGTLVLIPGVTCLLLALQWGGQKYSWSDGRIVALLTLTGVFLCAFVAIQILLPNTATTPPRIFKQRSVAAGFWSTLCIGASQYLYIWFQSIKHVSAVQSGIRLLPLTLAMVVASIFCGFTIKKVGYYTPFAIAGTCVMCIGAGLLLTIQVDTTTPKMIGYQILYGFGMGMAFQSPNLAVQTVLPQKDAPMGIALMFFGQLLGGAVFVSVGENVLDNQLVKRLSGFPGFSPSLVTSGGATSLIQSLPSAVRDAALVPYNESLRQVFLVGLIVTCLTVLGTFSLEWNSIKKPNQPKAEVDVESAKEKNGIFDQTER